MDLDQEFVDLHGVESLFFEPSLGQIKRHFSRFVLEEDEFLASRLAHLLFAEGDNGFGGLEVSEPDAQVKRRVSLRIELLDVGAVLQKHL